MTLLSPQACDAVWMRSPRLGFLRYSSDRLPVFMVALAACLSVAPFLLPRDVPLVVLAVWWIVSLYVRTFAPYAQHNHGHLPAFQSRTLNFAYDVLLAQVTGYPTAFWELHHNRGHHRHVLDPERDVARIVDLKTGAVMPRWWYALRGNLTILADSYRIGRDEAARGKGAILDKLFRELAVQVAITALLVAWSPALTVAFFVVPNLLAAYLVWWESYVHHLKVPGETVYDASVTVTGRRFNAFNFNIGHHTAHHEKPTLHWSLLPARTEAIAAKIPEVCWREDEGPGGLAENPALKRSSGEPPRARRSGRGQPAPPSLASSLDDGVDVLVRAFSDRPAPGGE